MFRWLLDKLIGRKEPRLDFDLEKRRLEILNARLEVVRRGK